MYYWHVVTKMSAKSSQVGLLQDKTGMSVLEGSMALAVAMMLCHGGQFLAVACGAPGMMIPIVTALTVALATIAPTVLAPLQSSAEAMACIIMQARTFLPTLPVICSIRLMRLRRFSLLLFPCCCWCCHAQPAI